MSTEGVAGDPRARLAKVRLTKMAGASFRDQAASAIRTAVVTGEIEGGKIYSVPSLASRFGVSATPVREAMLDLVSEGLAEPVPNRGFRIIEASSEDLDEIFELRVFLEVPALVRLAGSLSTADIERFGKLADAIELAAETADLVGFLEADRGFHLELLSLLGNQRLVAFVDRLRMQSRLPGLEALIGTAEFVSTAKEHRAILLALASGDRRRVANLMTRHLGHTRGVWAGIQE
jgi:DNA-binding GntR family transcriptional regulator